MLSEKARQTAKDVLFVSLIFAAISGAYIGIAVAERYRALTRAYIVQSEQILEILQQQSGKK
jgi:hypothetical protein